LPPQKYTVSSAVSFSEKLKSIVIAGFFGCCFLREFLKTVKTIKINNKCIRPLFLRKRGYAEKPTKEPTKKLQIDREQCAIYLIL
jgi:hypothetical protein